jgi:hypothetical protein
MENLLVTWLNPINLGVFILCAAAAIWLLSHTGTMYRDENKDRQISKQ